jgi:hypothetical protein
MLVSYSLYTFVQLAYYSSEPRPCSAEQGLRICGEISSAKPEVSIYGFKEDISAILNDEERLKATRSEYKMHKDDKKGEESETKWKDNFARMKKGK